MPPLETDLDTLVAALRALPAADRAAILRRFTQDERQDLEAMLSGPAVAAGVGLEGFSPAINALIVAARKGNVASITADARNALLRAEAALARPADPPQRRPSLSEAIGKMLHVDGRRS